MIVLAIRIPAGQYEQFTSEAAESMIGQDFVAKEGDYPIGIGRVVTARIVENGTAIDAEIEWPNQIP